MTPLSDIVEAYLQIALNGARPDDPRLAMLMNAMTNEEIERAKEAIAAEFLRREPVPPRAN